METTPCKKIPTHAAVMFQYIHYVQHVKTKTGSTDQYRLSCFAIESQ